MESVEELCDHIALINKSQKILDGSRKDIKNQYKTNTFQVDFIGKLNGFHTDFEIIAQKEIEPNHFSTAIKVKPNTSPNALLSALISQVEVHHFQEKIPSFNDIFISLVTGKPLDVVSVEYHTQSTE